MTTPTRSPDEYEQKYMSADGTVLFRDRATVPRRFLGIMGGVMAGLVAMGAVVPEAAAGALVGVPLVGMVTVLMMALRTTVTTEVVHIQYGLFGPRIPIDAIVSCQAVKYSFWKVGGWGVRRAMDGSMVYNMMGDGSRAAEIVYKDGKKEKKVLVSVKDLDGFVAAVNEARAQRAQQAGLSLADTRAALGVKDAPVRDLLGAAAAKGAAAQEEQIHVEQEEHRTR